MKELSVSERFDLDELDEREEVVKILKEIYNRINSIVDRDDITKLIIYEFVEQKGRPICIGLPACKRAKNCLNYKDLNRNYNTCNYYKNIEEAK